MPSQSKLHSPQQHNQKKPHKLQQSETIDEAERIRLQNLMLFEEDARRKGFHLIAGIDEAGRGPLAGPVVAAACILPQDFLLAGIDDSKKLTAAKRSSIHDLLTKNPEVSYGVGIISPEEIDRINILQATIQAMLQAVLGLDRTPDTLLVDGLKLPHPSIPAQKIIKGDSKSLSIAAASIIAKETRDRLMLQYHDQWPKYGFDKHKGYGTQLHREAIKKHGPCPIHRKTFEPVRSHLCTI